MTATRLGMSTNSEEVPQTAKGGEPRTAQTPSGVLEDYDKAVTGRMPLTSERSVSQVEGSEIVKDSEEVPQTAKGGKPRTAQTPSSVQEDSDKAVTGPMLLTSERSVSQMEGSESWKGQMSAARDSVEPNRPEKRSPARRRPSSGSEDRLLMLLREDAEEFGEFLHEGMSVAPPIVRSFEEDTLLKRPPPDFVLGQEHWLGLHGEIREKLWQGYLVVNPTTITEAEELTRMVEAISRTRKELAEKKAREVFEDSKLAEPQRLAAPPPTNAETSRTKVSAWVGSTSERRPAQEARWMP